MMKRKALWSFILAFLLALPIIGTALAAPPLPSGFYGTAKTTDGANLDDGTQVTAWINGTQYVMTATQTYNGESWYAFDVSGDDPDTPGIEGGVAGDTITFQIGGQDALETATWASGSSTQLNLTVDGGTPTPTPTVTPTSTPTGEADCDVGDGNACVSVLGDVFVDLANIIFPNFVLTGEEGYVRVEDVQGTVRDVDNIDTEWTPFLSAINVFSDGDGNTIPVGGADDLIVECLGIDGTGGPANPTCEALDFVRLSSSGEITTILSANPGTGSGNYPFELGFELLIPADTVPGNYATTINIDKIYGSGGPG